MKFHGRSNKCADSPWGKDPKTGERGFALKSTIGYVYREHSESITDDNKADKDPRGTPEYPNQ